jgi:hypothetical protein
MLSIEQQETFMHRIYDVIHNGIGMSNLKYALEDLQFLYGDLTTILNTRMKNEKYSSSLDLPIMKVIFETQSHIMSVSNEEFLQRKLDAIKLLQSYGAHLNVMYEQYMDKDINWDFYLTFGQIPIQLYDLIKENVKDNVKDNKIKIKI